MFARPFSRLLCLSAVCTSGVVTGQTIEQRDGFGDVMRFALPAAAALYSISRDDIEGAGQLGLTWGAAVLANQALDRTFHDPRPTGLGRGFASGHTAAAFAAAGYLHRRYGLGPAAPAYVLATVTGYERVHKHHHFTRQVVRGAAIGLGSAFVLTRPLPGGGTVGVVPAGDGIALQYGLRW